MKALDRLIWILVLLVVATAVLPAAVPPVTTLLVVATICFVVVQLVRHYTSRF
jgi:hypothetical protein